MPDPVVLLYQLGNHIQCRSFVYCNVPYRPLVLLVHKSFQQADQVHSDIHEYLNALGLPAEKIYELEVPEADRAHYSKRTIDIEYDFPIGKEELLGLAYRTNFD